MAINPIQFLLADVATATKGSTTISIQGTTTVNTNASTVFSGSAVFVGSNQVVEGIAGTAFDPTTNTSTITLRNAWPHPTVSARLVVFNTIEGLANAIQRARESAASTAEIQTAFGDVLTATTPTIDITIDGVVTTITPYGYLEAQTSALLATATDIVADIVAVEGRLDVVETELSTIEGTLTGLVTDAQTARTGAETAETNARASETNAATSEANAATSETNANNSAIASGTSETNAATSEANAGVSETNAATSATNAGTSETSAGASAGAASTSETNAATSESNAATSESNAITSETNAAASAVTSQNASSISQSNANYQGDWATNPDGSPRTGQASIPASYRHANAVWQLAANLTNIENSEPSGANTDYFLIGTIGGISPDSARLGNELPSFYATASSIVSLVPETRTVNGSALSNDVTITLASLSGVPETRTVNGKDLSTDISITATDLSLQNVDNTSDADKPVSSAQNTINLDLQEQIEAALVFGLLGLSS